MDENHPPIGSQSKPAVRKKDTSQKTYKTIGIGFVIGFIINFLGFVVYLLVILPFYIYLIFESETKNSTVDINFPWPILSMIGLMTNILALAIIGVVQPRLFKKILVGYAIAFGVVLLAGVGTTAVCWGGAYNLH